MIFTLSTNVCSQRTTAFQETEQKCCFRDMAIYNTVEIFKGSLLSNQLHK